MEIRLPPGWDAASNVEMDPNAGDGVSGVSSVTPISPGDGNVNPDRNDNSDNSNNDGARTLLRKDEDEEVSNTVRGIARDARDIHHDSPNIYVLFRIMMCVT